MGEIWHHGAMALMREKRPIPYPGNMLIGLNDDQALKMEVRSYEGIDFLIVERGGQFEGGPDDEGTEAVPADWHPGFHIYMRME